MRVGTAIGSSARRRIAGITMQHQKRQPRRAAKSKGSPVAAPTDNRKQAIFVYSGFRASSTWLWSKFRAHPSLLCFYEPFNEQLASLTRHNIEQARPDGWRSHHPDGSPYVLEYAGMLQDGAGVPGFPATKSLGQRYIGAAGPEGALDQDIAAYVQGLLDHAHECERVPLLACTRLLGRAHGLRSTFGGYHILLHRNLFQQWNSYAGQARFGNWYFLQTLYETIEIAGRDPVIAKLAQLFPEETCSSLEAWVSVDNFDRVFCYFVGFHLYFLTIARRSCDLVVDANALAGGDAAYREGVVGTIEADLGVRLDLEDAREQMDFPLFPVADPRACKVRIDEFAELIKSALGASPDERSFINTLVSDLWAEQAMFQRHTSGAFEYLAQIGAELATTRQALSHADEKLSHADAELDAERARSGRLEAELAAALTQGEVLQGSLAVAEGSAVDLTARRHTTKRANKTPGKRPAAGKAAPD